MLSIASVGKNGFIYFYFPRSSSDEPKLLLLWMKIIDLSLRQLQYVPNCIPLVLPHLITMVAMFNKFGEDRAKEGLLSKIGFGKKSEYAPK